MKQWLYQFFVEPIQKTNQEQREYLAQLQPQKIAWEPVAICITVAICLTLQEYCFTLSTKQFVQETFHNWIPTSWHTVLDAVENRELVRLGWGNFGDLIVYIIIPLLVTRFVCKRSLTDYGLGMRDAVKGWWVYLLMYLVMIGPIVVMSGKTSFQYTYPFYHLSTAEPLWPRFFIWEAMYAFQFIGLEFFFRGFMLHGTRRHFGVYAILAMTIPYCMIHFGKPLPETFAAIVAGIVLGFMSLKTRTVWLGAALHIAVAWSMDFASLLRTGRIVLEE
ncbi:MAG: membrane protease YdiL (CAAX protease family) [Pirellulaceae bacterium]|jgi:membrane protease YdiL (CAAX protease family)